MRHRRVVLGSVIPALVAGMTLSTLGQPADPTPTIGVRPVGTTSSDPNAGQWFIATLQPGGDPVTLEARLTNPADVPQTVRIFVAAMEFGDDGSPTVIAEPVDVATWATVPQPVVTVPPRRDVIAPFTLRAPTDADPGDHVGALVVEGAPERAEGSAIGIVKRVATRLYATIPGSAKQDLSIESIQIAQDSTFFPREVTVTVALRNTGRIRLTPTVKVNGRDAPGPKPLMSQSVERYVAGVPIPFWGGPQRYRIEVTTQTAGGTGPAKLVRASKFIFPWHLLVLVAVGAGAGWAGRRLLRRRGGRYEALQSDIRRIERLLSGRARGDVPDEVSEGGKAEAAITAAMKQARRSGDAETERRLKQKLIQARAPKPRDEPDAGPALDPLEAILLALEDAPPKRQTALIEAARAFGPKALREHAGLIDTLPEDVRTRLLSPSGARTPKRSQGQRSPKRRP